jgi:enoyl-CoA hydratase
MQDAPPVLVAHDERDATITLNRPAVRNAISSELLRQLRAALAEVDTDPEVDVVVLTGADPAFCAGLDLKELGAPGSGLQPGSAGDDQRPWPPLRKPIIGAVNGVAVTGGFEFALNCDMLIASERARFADTHARVGVLPGWGLSFLLPLAVGHGLARRMSLTGDYLSAAEALRAGLVTEVVAHDDLLAAAHRLAAAIVSNNQDAVRALVASYREIEREQTGAGLAIEARTSRDWLARGFDPAAVEHRRRAVESRGRAQAGGGSGDA